MTRHFPPSVGVTDTSSIVIDAVRGWREARDSGRPVQPHLARALAAYDCVMLAPVFDSLCLFYEAALGRPIEAGRMPLPSSDEHMLIGLVDGASPRQCIVCSRDRATALDCALCSTRIMLALTIGQPAARALRGPA